MRKSTCFAGAHWYNPYQELKPDSVSWKKANFHIHAEAWGGITNGHQSDENIYATYSNLGFELIGISNYQKNIDKIGDSSFVPCYEHGYGIKKNHHIVIGDEQVSWKDFPMWQHKQHKQDVLHGIQHENNFVAIAHPSFLGAFDSLELQQLTHFDGIEIASRTRRNLKEWDWVLSSGYPATLICNDDCHNTNNIRSVGHFITLVQAENDNPETVIDALKKGRTIGVEMFTPIDSNITFKQRKFQIEHLESIPEIQVLNDTLFVKSEDPCIAIKFIGQNGELKHFVWQKNSAYYPLHENDTYIRVKFDFASLNTFYCNPVWRYKQEPFELKIENEKNSTSSMLYQIMGILVVLLLLFFEWKLIRKWKNE